MKYPKWLTWHSSDGSFWFRVRGGYGLAFTDRSKWATQFSVRHGIKKQHTLGKWAVVVLHP